MDKKCTVTTRTQYYTKLILKKIPFCHILPEKYDLKKCFAVDIINAHPSRMRGIKWIKGAQLRPERSFSQHVTQKKTILADFTRKI